MTAILAGVPGCEGLPTTSLALEQPGAAQALAAQGTPPGSTGDANHPNVFVRGLPLAWGESELASVFSQYGELSSIRLVRHSMTKHSLGYGFVRYGSVSDAQMAITALDGTTVLGHKLQVKFADADAGPPAAAAPSGLTPSDSCYAKHLPANWGAREVQQLFEAHGAVLDVKLFPCLDQFRGASALIRMASVEAAERAINALNNTTPASGVQSLIVRYAESAAEKAARLQRRERQQQQQQQQQAGRGQVGLPRVGLSSGSLAPVGGTQGLLAPQSMMAPEQQLQQALSALSLGSDGGLMLPSLGSVGMQPQALGGTSLLRPPAAQLPLAPMIPVQYQPPTLSSASLRGLPPQADRLWVYEHFSRFGPIASLQLAFDEATGLCSGSGIVNFADPSAADRARQVLNGMRAGDKVLLVVADQGVPMGAGRPQQGPAGAAGHGIHLGLSPTAPGYSDGSSSTGGDPAGPSPSALQLGFQAHEWQSLGHMPAGHSLVGIGAMQGQL